MGRKLITICHKRNDCIGCGSCVLYAPNQWTMNQEDGKSDLQGAERKGEFMVAKIDAVDEDANRQAAESCPVGIIRVG